MIVSRVERFCLPPGILTDAVTAAKQRIATNQVTGGGLNNLEKLGLMALTNVGVIGDEDKGVKDTIEKLKAL
jgi:hypothetical protein